MLLRISEKDHTHYKTLETVRQLLGRIADVMHNIRNIRAYETKPYIEDCKILDLKKSAGKA